MAGKGVDVKLIPNPRDDRPAHALLLQLGMLMYIVSNVLGSTIQITTLPLPVLSTLQAVRLRASTGGVGWSG